MVAFRRFTSRFSWDLVGFSASALCAVHCAVLPVIMMGSAMAGNELLHHHAAETGILMVSAFVGSIAIVPGRLRHHRRNLPLIIFLTGIVLIAVGRFHWSMMSEMLITTSGALLVATSHWLNWKFCRPYHQSQRTQGH